MAFSITVNSDHTLTFGSNTLAYQNEAGVSVTVTLDAATTVLATGKLSYIDFLLPDGTPYFKGSYDGSGGSFIMTLGATDTILEQDGRIGIQFVIRDVAPPNSTEIWKSELKFANIKSSANATSHALTPVIPPLTFPATFPAEDVSIADAGGYYAGSNVEDALQEVGLALTKESLGNFMYPIGSIYISVGSTSPATLFGGTWSVFGAGKVLVGIDSGDADFDTVEKTIGAKTHALTEAEGPAHTHNQQYKNGTLGSGGNYYAVPTGGVTTAEYLDTTMAPTNVITQSSGSGTAHNNIQPSIVVRMWKRTA